MAAAPPERDKSVWRYLNAQSSWSTRSVLPGAALVCFLSLLEEFSVLALVLGIAFLAAFIRAYVRWRRTDGDDEDGPVELF